MESIIQLGITHLKGNSEKMKSDNKIKLSIVTINFNNAEGLQKTFESIICQTFNDFELIVIDGGSTDKSIEIIKVFKNNITFWKSEADSGIYEAMNKGIQEAGGEYCFFLNSGDYLVNNNVLHEVFKNKLYGDIVFGNLLVCLNGKVVGKSIGKECLTFLDVYSSTIKHQASFIKRQLFVKSGLFNEDLKIIADWEFFLRTVGLGGASYQFLKMDISYFDNDGISNNNQELVKSERKRVIDKYLPQIMQPDYEYLLKYGKYKILTKYWITDFILRILTKITVLISKGSILG